MECLQCLLARILLLFLRSSIKSVCVYQISVQRAYLVFVGVFQYLFINNGFVPEKCYLITT